MNQSDSRRYGHGYRIFVQAEGRARVHVQRELTSSELRRLDRDLQGASGSLTRVKSVDFHLDIPLSPSLSRALTDLTQRYEILATVSVPPLDSSEQPPLADELLRPSDSWLHVVPRAWRRTC
jgi:hypothetical protein